MAEIKESFRTELIVNKFKAWMVATLVIAIVLIALAALTVSANVKAQA